MHAPHVVAAYRAHSGHFKRVSGCSWMSQVRGAGPQLEAAAGQQPIVHTCWSVSWGCEDGFCVILSGSVHFPSSLVWSFGTVWYIPFSEAFVNFTVLVSFVRLMRTKHLWQRQKLGLFCFSAICFWWSLSRNAFSVFVFWVFFFWRPRRERKRYMANYVTSIFPLNLEPSSPPWRIQNWSLTFSLVPSLAWSHFLSIWFLAPYATFLFPACRQQGVALLSPS